MATLQELAENRRLLQEFCQLHRAEHCAFQCGADLTSTSHSTICVKKVATPLCGLSVRKSGIRTLLNGRSFLNGRTLDYPNPPVG
jgi:hypothetical protein